MSVADLVPATQGRLGDFDYVTIPVAGVYRIDVWGAQGGDVTSHGGRGGFGAYMSGFFDLEAGVELKILVGKQATWTSGTRTGGGGGGSFVCLMDNTPLIVAGGGGGALDANNGQDARTTNSGTGNGGNAACGAGLHGDGLPDSWVNPGAYSFISGGMGAGPGNYGQEGGFGGGGCTHGYYGTQYPGGGGYTGGASGRTLGAGSYNTGFDQSNQVGTREGNGRVLVELIQESNDGVDGIWHGISRLRGYADAFVQMPFFRVETFSHLPYNDLKAAFAAMQRKQMQGARNYGPQTGFYDGPW